jgi:hypothetical protein
MTDKKEDQQTPPEAKTNETDPQENMQGPISSMMQGIKEGAEENNEVTKEEADEEKDERM